MEERDGPGGSIAISLVLFSHSVSIDRVCAPRVRIHPPLPPHGRWGVEGMGDNYKKTTSTVRKTRYVPSMRYPLQTDKHPSGLSCRENGKKKTGQGKGKSKEEDGERKNRRKDCGNSRVCVQG